MYNSVTLIAASGSATNSIEVGDVYVVVISLLVLVVLPAVLIFVLVVPSVAPGWWGKVFKKSRRIATSRTSDIALTVSATKVQPGQELEVMVELAPKQDFHIRSAVVQLIRVETYIHEMRHKRGRSYYMRTVEKVMVQNAIIEEQAAHKMRNVKTAAKLTVPQDALPTIEGPTCSRIKPGIFYKVKVECDIPGKADLVEEKEIIVLKPPRTDVLPARPTFVESNKKACSLTLSLESADICSQGSLAGMFKVEMHQDINISRAVVKLSSYAKFGDVGTSIDIDKSVLSQDMMLLAGQTYSWPFKLNIGVVSAPTLHIDKSRIEYYVKGKLDRRMRLDPSVSQDINVHI